MMRRPTRRVLGGLLVLAGSMAAPCRTQAAVFGVPTNLDTTNTTNSGLTTGASVNPPGWFALDGTSNGFGGGEGVHQIRLFIEVTGTTLDLLVFDAGASGARDISSGANPTTTTYTLVDPAGATLATFSMGDETTLQGGDGALTTEDRLTRFTPPCGAGTNSCGFFRLNNGGPNNVSFAGLSRGLYEFRITTSGGTESNAFGLQVAVAKDPATGLPTGSYNAYTTANSDANIGAPTATETSWLTAALNAGTPPANIVQPQVFFPYMNRGCAAATSDFDMDADTGSGAGSSGSLVDVLGATTTLTMSDSGAHEENAITVESTAATNLESINYGMYTVTNNTGSQQNATDWRLADFTGWSNNPGASPRNATNPIRIYMPTAYAPVTGSPNATAPVEPILAASARVASGANPPAAGSATTYAITATVNNPTTSAISGVQITVGVPSPVTFAGNEDCFVDGVSQTANCTFTNSGAGTPFWRRVTLNTSLAAGSALTLDFDATLNPAAAGLQNLTGAPAAGAPPPNTTVWAQYTPAFSSATFTRTETLGPVCNLVVNVGGGPLPTRATLRGLRVEPATGVVTFATGSQRETAAFRLWGTDDAGGRGPRALLTQVPIRAPTPNSLTPVVYRAQVGPLASRFLLIEEIDRHGRRHVMGPFALDDAHLRSALDAIEARLDAAGVPTGGGARFVPPALSGRLARPRRIEAALGAGTSAPPRGIKIEVSAAGKVQVPLADLEAQGLPAGTATNQLRLKTQGHPVPFAVSAGVLSFTSRVLSTDYTGRNVYVLSWGGQVSGPRVPLTRSEEPRAASDVRVQRNTIYVPNIPEENSPWVWDLLVGDGTSWPYGTDPTAGDFDLPDLASGATGLLPVKIRLVGRTQHLHSVEAAINGVTVGGLTFEGMVSALLVGQIPAAALQVSGNHLTLTYSSSSTGADAGLVYLGHLDVGAPVVTATTPVTPDRLAPYDPTLPSFAGADYVIVTHPLFSAQADGIASLESGMGHRAVVVDVERAYDALSSGIVEANAVKELLRRAATNGRLRYVLLVGGDTFDTHDYLGTGAVAFVPSLLSWDGEFGRVPSENRYADLNGDGTPELAIGRLPARSVAEAAVLADKIAGESAAVLAGGRRHLVAVDNQGPLDVSFRDEATFVVGRLPLGSAVTWADVGQDLAAARTTLLDGLRQGALATHYFGHAGPEVWADEGLLTVDDVATLAGSSGQTVLFTWACEAQWYQSIFGPSVGEALMLLPGGGAVASFGPAGATDPLLQRSLFARVYAPWLVKGVPLGEAIRRAKVAALADPANRPVVEGWNLLGDPALPGPSPGVR